MKRKTLRQSALTLLVTALLGACTLISEVDRSKIADETPDPGSLGGESGDGDMGDGDMGDGDMGDGDMGDGDMGGGGGVGGDGGASN